MSESLQKFDWKPLLTALPVLLICLLSGCATKSELNTQYGKIAGSQGADSLNGTGVFADMFAERGFEVKRRTKISPRIERYDTLVWFPDDFSCPSEEAIIALNNWLENGDDRTIIYVGRDYDARTDYLRQVKDSAPVEQKEELLRQIAEGKLGQDDQEQADGAFAWFDKDTTTCEWFEHKKVQRQRATTLSGPMAAGLDPQKAMIEISTVLEPIKDDETWKAESRLDANGYTIVTKLMRNDSVSEGKVVVVSNGSFLLNYALVNSENRKLATELIDECDSFGGVVFLESGTRGIDVSDSDTINHNTWAWISQPPLRYIVPHFLMWGVLFCFVFFPIFGRPKNFKKRNTSTFRAHVNAMGKLLGRSDQMNRAVDKIRHYQHLVSGESKRKNIDD